MNGKGTVNREGSTNNNHDNLLFPTELIGEITIQKVFHITKEE